MSDIQIRRDTRFRLPPETTGLDEAYKVYVDNEHWGWTRKTKRGHRSNWAWVIWNLAGEVVISTADSGRLGTSFDDAAYFLRKKLAP